MDLFIFDYHGTLTTLSDPTAFVRALRGLYPDSKVMLYTGTSPDEVDDAYPALRSVLDAFWEKPCSLPLLLKGVVFDRVIYVDDDESLRRAATRVFQRISPCVPVSVLGAEGLTGLLQV